MGLFQAAYRTYESQKGLAGIPQQGQETLTPVSHIVQNAHIEITINEEGQFTGASIVPKSEAKTIIPATEESANRVGDNERAHPLSDQLRYLAPYGGKKYEAYQLQLRKWAESDFSHPKTRAVLAYTQKGSILEDLAAAGIVSLTEDNIPNNGKIEGIEYDKCLIRWRVFPSENAASACWEDPSLFNSFLSFYQNSRQDQERDICVITGLIDVPAVYHPKGVIQTSFGAKLISANDNSGFTYRGRFTEASQSGPIGYLASQKAHSALRWLAANHGVLMGGRTFLWWNPEGKALPAFDFLGFSEQKKTFVSAKEQLQASLAGYRLSLKAEDDVIVAVLDAATTGRLSVTYYNELRAEDFFNRLEDWYSSCRWNSQWYGLQFPPLKSIVKFAFGTQRNNFIETDDRLLKEHAQRLLHCLIDGQPIPVDIVRSLAANASRPLAYTPSNRESLLVTACAVIRKHRNQGSKKEEWTLALDENNHDRSYLFGRLLAVAEYVERKTYDRDENREPNAIRMQTVFSQRPIYAWRILEEAIEPYYKRLKPGQRYKYRKITQNIVEKLSPENPDLNKKLDDIYLLGYYHQRADLYASKNNTIMEENEDESAQQEN